MGIHMGEAAAAVAAGTNLLADSWIEYSKYWRRISRIGIAGSVDNTDFPDGISLYYGEREVARMWPNLYGANAIPQDDDMLTISSKKLCPPNTALRLVPTGAIDTNPLNFILESQEYVRRGARFGRGAAGCGFFEVFTTAVQPVGTDLLSGKSFKVSDRDRKITRIGLIGGAAVKDGEVDVSFGSEQVMHLYNTHVTATALNKTKLYWHTSQLVCPANVPLNIKVTDEFTADDYFLLLDIQEA